MANQDLVKTPEELKQLADVMAEELKRVNEPIVSRHIRLVRDGVTFVAGKKLTYQYPESNVNKELMGSGVYTQTAVDDLTPRNFKEVAVARDLQDHRFRFNSKGLELPKDERIHFEAIPTETDYFDQELAQFSKDHPSTRLSRNLTIEQRIVVNSNGGIAIQSVPFFGISYSHGYNPIPTSRDISVICNTNEDIRRMPELIKYLADPTPDGKIRSSQNFSEAFDNLYKISGLKFGSLEDAGIPLSELYDIVMLTGVPVHEIFGHHFEEPIRYLDFGESGTFKLGQQIKNNHIVFKDDPRQKIEGFRVFGFTHFDAYGRNRPTRMHIKDGKVLEFLGSEYADPEKLKQHLNMEKSQFVGNATQYVDGFFPQSRMSCSVMDGKTEKIDLEGKILLVSHSGHTQPQDKTYMVKAHEAYVVRDGIPKRVIPLQVTGGINQALANIVLLRNQSYQTGLCGKPEPIYYPSSRGSAQAPVSQFARNQLWTKQQVYPLPISDMHLKVLTEKR